MLGTLINRIINVCDAQRWAHSRTETETSAKITVRVPVGSGKSENAIINVWASGTVQVQGKAGAQAQVREQLAKDGVL
jgi:hypothetical protein